MRLRASTNYSSKLEEPDLRLVEGGYTSVRADLQCLRVEEKGKGSS